MNTKSNQQASANKGAKKKKIQFNEEEDKRPFVDDIQNTSNVKAFVQGIKQGEEKRDISPVTNPNQRPMSSTMMNSSVNASSAQLSSQDRSNSRLGRSRGGPNQANRKILLELMRPTSSLFSPEKQVMPALAQLNRSYINNGGAQLQKYNPVRRGTKTPIKQTQRVKPVNPPAASGNVSPFDYKNNGNQDRKSNIKQQQQQQRPQTSPIKQNSAKQVTKFTYNQSPFKSNNSSFYKRGTNINQSMATVKTSTLGPGSYDPKYIITKQRSPEAQILGKNSQTRFSENPGPGEYNEPQKFGDDAVKVSINPVVDLPRNQKTSPGPSDYKPIYNQIQDRIKNGKISPARNISPNQFKTIDQVPGPGSYDLDLTKIGVQLPNYTISQSSKNLPQNLISPGPGFYNPKIEPTREKSPSYTIDPNHRRAKSGVDINPGPGSYAQQSRIGEGPHYSISNSNKTGKNHNNPLGPGYYNPNDRVIQEKVKAFKFSHQFQSQQKTGKFTQRSNSRPDIKAGDNLLDYKSSKRYDPVRNSYHISQSRQGLAQPGPGFYQTVDNFASNSKKMTISGKAKPTKIETNPGPGFYNAKDELIRKSPVKHSVTKSQRIGQVLNKDQVAVPGPGFYATPSPFGKNAKKVSIHQKLNSNSRTNNPGPGQYNPTDKLVRNQSPLHAMSGSRQQSISKEIGQPGPGTYEVKPRFPLGDPSYTMGSKRSQNLNNGVPSPSHYIPQESLVHEQNPLWTIPRSQKGSPIRTDHQLGPGQYDFRDHRFPQISYSVSNLLRPDSVSKDQKLNPGPSAYEVQRTFGKVGPHYTMGSSSPNRAYDDQPGPGGYNPQYTLKEQRSVLGIINPSPERPLTSRNTPGPTTYNPNDTIVRLSSPKYKFSRNPGALNRSVELIGPGSYNMKTKIGEGPHYTISPSRNVSPDNKNPGPGQYQPNNTFTHLKSPEWKFSNNRNGNHDGPSTSPNRLGPGDYNMKTTIGKGPHYTISASQKFSPTNRNPGPGQYQPEDGIIHEKNPQWKFSNNPNGNHEGPSTSPNRLGPGEYNMKTTIGEGPHYTISASQKFNPANRNPGPADYQPDDGITHEKNPQWKFSLNPQGNHDGPSINSNILGPGQYQMNSHIGEGPHYTIGMKREGSPGFNYPGPTTYNPATNQTTERAPHWQFSLGQNGNHEGPFTNSNNLGPGQYNLPSYLGEGPKYTMGDKREVSPDNKIPGPGYYQPGDGYIHEKAPEWKFSNNPNGNHDGPAINPNQLGPGSYNQPSYLGEGPKYTMGDKRETGSPNKNPGPGYYQPEDGIIHESAPQWKFSDNPQGNHEGPSINQNKLGPGSYNFVPFLGEGPQYSMGAKREQGPANNNPGPADYKPEDGIIHERAPQWKYFNSPNGNHEGPFANQNDLGPGQYNLPSYLGEGPKYTMGDKRENGPINKNPGPSDYYPLDGLTHENAPYWRFPKGPVGTQLNKDQVDAPEGGRYDPKDNKYPNIQYTIGNLERPDQVSKDQRSFPAPGQYNQPGIIGEDAPKYTIGIKLVNKMGDEFPEPGHYNPNTDLKYQRSPQAFINPQGVQPSPVLTPGPADYNPDYNLVQLSSPVANLAPGSERPNQVSKDQKEYPGPGTYDLKDPNAPLSYTIGLQERLNTVSRDQRLFPGPGTYNGQGDLIGKDAPKYSAGQRHQSPNGDNFPSPGSYDPKILEHVPLAVIMPVHSADPSALQTPGPHEYNPNLKLARESSPAPRFAQTKRDFLTVSQSGGAVPGPGTYNASPLNNTIAYTIGEKLQGPQANPFNGPGSYDLNYSAVQLASPKNDFGKSPERDTDVTRNLQTSANLGPGTYDIQKDGGAFSEGISYSFNHEARDKSIEETPGPGQYKIPVKFGEQRLYEMPIVDENWKYV